MLSSSTQPFSNHRHLHYFPWSVVPSTQFALNSCKPKMVETSSPRSRLTSPSETCLWTTIKCSKANNLWNTWMKMNPMDGCLPLHSSTSTTPNSNAILHCLTMASAAGMTFSSDSSNLKLDLSLRLNKKEWRIKLSALVSALPLTSQWCQSGESKKVANFGWKDILILSKICSEQVFLKASNMLVFSKEEQCFKDFLTLFSTTAGTLQ